MGATFRFLATPSESVTVVNWFRSLSGTPPTESHRDIGVLLYFPDFGPLATEAKKSPLVSIFLPRKCRGILTTIGEVHFLSTPSATLSQLNKVSRQFRSWLRSYPCVHSKHVKEWAYFLEGSTKNSDTDIFGFPEGLLTLQRGSYFVSQDDNDSVLDRVCRTLQLRGVDGLEYQHKSK